MLAPAAWLPVIGPALRRAEEYTCDRYGVACCQSPADIKAALAAIAAGDTRWQTINVDAFVGQVAVTNGFWMSFNEITGDYPWLTKRMAAAIALSEGREVSHPGRSKLAWFFALFVPRLGVGGGAASLLVMVAIVGILAAVAIPQYQEYVERSRYQDAYLEGLGVTDSVDAYVSEHQAWPGSMAELGYGGTFGGSGEDYTIDVYDGGVIGIEMGVDETGESEYIVLEPEVTDNGLFWSCYGQNAVEKLLPADCR